MTQQNDFISMFSALGDKTRYKLLQILVKRPNICVSELADEVGISTAGTSQQLKILEQSGLIERIRNGQKICYEPKRDDSNANKIFKLIKE